MSAFESALQVYRDGRLVIEATRDIAVLHDELRWAREDLEEVLLDLKLAVLDADRVLLHEHLKESRALMAEIIRIIDHLPDEQ